ncbi:hypothetical protein QN239_26835 [Mycolicibacterium sp. Y3]
MSNVELDISTKIIRKDLNQSVAEVERKLKEAGGPAGVGFKNEFNRAAKLDPAQPSEGKSAVAGERNGRAYGRAYDRAAGRELDSLTKRIEKLTTGVGGLGSAGGSFAMAGAAPALLAATGAAFTAAGAFAALPAALVGAGAGFGALAVATRGFGDAIKHMGDPKKFAEDLQSLSPAAQQAALEIQNLAQGPLKALKQATQERFFDGLAGEIHQLSDRFLPSVEKTTTGIAGAFNSMLKGVGDQLLTPQTSAAISSTLTNVTTAFQNLAPAAGPLTKAIADLVQVGSTFLPGFATSISNAATEFAHFIESAKESGQLKQWIGDGVDMLKQIGSIVWEAGRAFAALAPVAKDVLPGIASAAKTIADALKEHPGLIYAVVGAFMAWKSIEGLSSVITSLGTIKTALTGLPAVANAAAGGISTALAAVSIPAWLTTLAKWGGPAMVGLQSDVKNAGDLGLPEFEQGPDGKLRPKFNGGGGSFAEPGKGMPAIPGFGQHWEDGKGWMPDRPGHGMPAAPGFGQKWDPKFGWVAEDFKPYSVPGVPADGGGKGIDMPVVARPNIDPMSLIQGYPVTSSLYGAAAGVVDAQTKVAQDNANLQALLASNAAKEGEITKARNELAQAQQDQIQAELRLQEAKDEANKTGLKGLQDASSAFSELSAGLDKDLGFSKGLPGLADNLVKFVASLATAPLNGLLAPIAAQGNGAYGALGMLFGGSNSTASTAAQGMSVGGYPGDRALLSRVPAGSYDNATKDLSRGLADCSSAVEDLVNLMDGKSTAGGSLTTHNADQLLPGMGFAPGMGGPGDFRIGFNPSHMQATLPGGTPFNWGSDAAAARGGVGGTGADDPSFTSHYHRPTAPPVPSIAAAGPSPSPVDIYGPHNTDPGLNSPLPPPGSFPGGGGRGPGNMPQGLPFGTPYQAQGIDHQNPGWQPQGGGGIGITGGLMGAAMQAGIAAMGTAGAPFGGQAAAAAAQMGMQLIDRTTKFAGQAAGIGAEGLIDTFSVTNPDTGKNPLKDSWLWRAAGALAGAAPAIGSGGAGMLDKAANKKAQQQSPNSPQQQQSNQQSGPLFNIENWHDTGGGGKSSAVDLAGYLAAQGYQAGMSR